jgi:hypothetical protein
MEQQELNKEKIEINIDNTDNALGWLERILVLIKDYGPLKIVGAALLISLVSSILYFTLNPSKIIEIYDGIKDDKHTELMNLRLQMAPKIQSLTDKLTYGIGATRTVVLEMHNGNTGSGGLPFTKCSATYESLNLGKHPVAQQYQDVNMSLMPFATMLFDNGYWCGNTDDLQEIDRALYYKMKSNGTEHFAACVIEGVDNTAIAFMIVSFDKEDSSILNHDCSVTRDNIRHIAMELAIVLEVTRLLE